MIIEQIDENKLKITLSGAELSLNNISPKDLSPSSGKLKRFLVSLVRRAALETGFEVAGGNIMIESRSAGDGLIFFITKTPSFTTASSPKTIKSPVLKSCVKPVKKNASAVFVFQNKKSFAEFFSTVRNEDFSFSVLYNMEDKYYFKTLTDGRLFVHALEFASPVYSQLLAIRLSKEGKFICKGDNFFKFL